MAKEKDIDDFEDFDRRWERNASYTKIELSLLAASIVFGLVMYLTNLFRG